MNRILFAALLITSATTAASATTVVGNKALGIIEAFRIVGVVSQKDTPGQLKYRHDVACTRDANVAINVTDPSFAVAKYNCNLGSAKATGAKAKVLYDGGAITFGTTGDAYVTTTQGSGLACQILLAEADLDKRFVCNFN